MTLVHRAIYILLPVLLIYLAKVSFDILKDDKGDIVDLSHKTFSISVACAVLSLVVFSHELVKIIGPIVDSTMATFRTISGKK